MPRNNALTFDDPQTIVVRRARIKAEGDIPVELGVVVAGPAELVDQYLEAAPITIEALPPEAYAAIRKELGLEDGGRRADGKEPVRPEQLPTLHVLLRVVDAPREAFTLRVRVDPPVNPNCSHHYDFYANSVSASIISNTYGDPDLDLDYYYYNQWIGYSQYESVASASVNTGADCRWRLRVYGAGGAACDYELDAAFLRTQSLHTEVADNSASSPIGW